MPRRPLTWIQNFDNAITSTADATRYCEQRVRDIVTGHDRRNARDHTNALNTRMEALIQLTLIARDNGANPDRIIRAGFVLMKAREQHALAVANLAGDALLPEPINANFNADFVVVARTVTAAAVYCAAQNAAPGFIGAPDDPTAAAAAADAVITAVAAAVAGVGVAAAVAAARIISVAVETAAAVGAAAVTVTATDAANAVNPVAAANAAANAINAATNAAVADINARNAADVADPHVTEALNIDKTTTSPDLVPFTENSDQTSQLESMLQDEIDKLPEHSDLRASLEEYLADLQALHTETPLKQAAVELTQSLTLAELRSAQEDNLYSLHDSIAPAEEPLKASEFDLSSFVIGMDAAGSGVDLLAGLGGITIIGSGANTTHADGLTA